MTRRHRRRPVEWARTPAIRLALVARSAQFEKNDPVTNQPVTLAAPLWSGSGTTPYRRPDESRRDRS